MMVKSEMDETCSWDIMYNCKYSCVTTAVPMHNYSFIIDIHVFDWIYMFASESRCEY
jgi:hypothetical protein